MRQLGALGRCEIYAENGTLAPEISAFPCSTILCSTKLTASIKTQLKGFIFKSAIKQI